MHSSYVLLLTSFLAMSVAIPVDPNPAPTTMVSNFPIPSTPPLPMPVDPAVVESDNGDNSNVTVSSSSPGVIGLETAENSPINQLDIGMCITPFKVGQGVQAGMYFRFADVSVNKVEYVDFLTSGPVGWVLWKFFQSHNNADGFWEDLNTVVRAVVNIGYHPRNKQINLAGMDPSTTMSEAEVKLACNDIFGIGDADVGSGAFGQSYVGGDLPNLLNPN